MLTDDENDGKEWCAMTMINKVQLSKALPEFGKLRCGTQVFVFINEQRLSVYDDFSDYPDPKATRWQINVYNRTNAVRYDRICTHKGEFTDREQALAEIDRFRYRGGDLVFYLVPVDFTYNRLKYIWGENEVEEGTATYTEQAEEARKRLLAMMGRIPKGETDIRRRKIKSDVLEAFCNDSIAIKRRLFPFALVSGCTVLYVSADKSQWRSERFFISSKWREDGVLHDGIVPAYVKYPWSDEGEYGDIAYKKIGGSIRRV